MKSLSAGSEGDPIGRSREGAWIEIHADGSDKSSQSYVAPARERGLKLLITRRTTAAAGRSREGAWIEISLSASPLSSGLSSLPRGSVD